MKRNSVNILVFIFILQFCSICLNHVPLLRLHIGFQKYDNLLINEVANSEHLPFKANFEYYCRYNSHMKFILHFWNLNDELHRIFLNVDVRIFSL